MRNRKIVVLGIAATLLFTYMFLHKLNPSPTQAKSIEQNKEDVILQLGHPTIVYGKILKDCPFQDGFASDSEQKGTFQQGEVVEILEDRSESRYKVRSVSTGTIGFVDGDNMSIDSNEYVEKKLMSKEEQEIFAVAMEFTSDTDYFVWVDILRQQVNIFKKKNENGHWERIRSVACATGHNTSPTTRGTFQISERGEWFYSERLESGAMYWMRFNDTYLLHTVAMDRNRNVIDGVLGERRSKGCVRMSIEDTKWIYDTVPDGSTVFVN